MIILEIIAAIAAIVLLILAIVEGSFVSTVGFIVIASIFGYHYMDILLQNLELIVYGSIVFFVIGSLYSVLYYWPKIVRRKLINKRTDESAQEFIDRTNLYPSKYISQLTVAILFWPILILEPIIYDPVSYVIKAIINICTNTMNKITLYMVNKYDRK